MSSETATSVGQVATLWRYPIKSMLGEELLAAQIVGGTLLGDRAFALVDRETGKVVSAKNPRNWRSSGRETQSQSPSSKLRFLAKTTNY